MCFYILYFIRVCVCLRMSVCLCHVCVCGSLKTIGICGTGVFVYVTHTHTFDFESFCLLHSHFSKFSCVTIPLLHYFLSDREITCAELLKFPLFFLLHRGYGFRNFFENTAAVQFNHRLLAGTTACAVATLWTYIRCVCYACVCALH